MQRYSLQYTQWASHKINLKNSEAHSEDGSARLIIITNFLRAKKHLICLTLQVKKYIYLL